MGIAIRVYLSANYTTGEARPAAGVRSRMINFMSSQFNHNRLATNMSLSKLILPILIGITVVLCVALSGCTSPSTTATKPTATSAATTAAYVTTSTPIPSPAPLKANVSIASYMYDPRTVTIAAGGTVSWECHTSSGAYVAFPGEPTHTVSYGSPYTRTFPKPGTYDYTDGKPNGLKGTVIVV